jgi:hypothetical protein
MALTLLVSIKESLSHGSENGGNFLPAGYRQPDHLTDRRRHGTLNLSDS